MGAGIGFGLLVLLSATVPDAATSLAIVPWPGKVIRGPGEFRLTPSTHIQAPPALRGVAEWFRSELHPGTGLPLAIRAHASGSRVVLTLDPRLASTLGDEGYRLEVTRQTVEVRAAKPAGVFYGLQTFRQLLPAAVVPAGPRRPTSTGRRPAVEIEDQPRFAWRGSHLDVGRHFLPKEFLLKHLDLMALHKLNVFHWHLTEDQGWRIEIKKYPKLTEVGAWRKDSALGPPPARGPDGRQRLEVPGQGPRRLLHAGRRARGGALRRRAVHHRGARRSRCPATPGRRWPPIPSWATPASRWRSRPPGASSRRSSASRTGRCAFLQDVLDGGAGHLPVEVHPRRRRRGAQGRVEGRARPRRRA